MSILIVEDDPTEAEVTKARLAKLGWADVRIAASIAEVRETSDAFDVALLDLGLPDTAGLETLHAFRACRHDLPVIVLTGTDDDQMAAAAIQAGADAYLVKNDLSEGSLRRAVTTAQNRRNKANQGLERLVGRLEGKEAVVILFQQMHEQVMTACSEAGIDIDKTHFVDMTRRHMDLLVAPPGVSVVGSPVQLEKASIRAIRALSQMETPQVFIDSLETMRMYNGPARTAEFLDIFSRRLAMQGHALAPPA